MKLNLNATATPNRLTASPIALVEGWLESAAQYDAREPSNNLLTKQVRTYGSLSALKRKLETLKRRGYVGQTNVQVALSSIP
jgi:pyridoxine/pyridoxamine 5'-phosphate oxidase